MKWMANLKIRRKLTLGFGVVLALMIAISLVAIWRLLSVDENYSYTLDFPVNRLSAIDDVNLSLEKLRRLAAALGTQSDEATIASYEKMVSEQVTEIKTRIQIYDGFINTDPLFSEAEKQERLAKTKLVTDQVDQYYRDYIPLFFDAVSRGDIAAYGEIGAAGAPLIIAAQDSALELMHAAEDVVDTQSDAGSAMAAQALTVIIIIAVVAIFVAIMMMLLITNGITKPVKVLTDTLSRVTDGDFSVNATSNDRDEIGDLTRDVGKVVDVIKSLVSDIATVSDLFDKGDIEASIDESKYQGAYRTVASGVNQALSTLVNETLRFIECMVKFSEGDFEANIPKLPGKKIIMNTSRDELRANLMGVNNDIALLVKNASNGKLDEKLIADKYKGDWQNIMLGLNDLMDTIVAPIKEVQSVLTDISNGNFDISVRGEYRGTFAEIKDAMNNTVQSIASYIQEITEILGQIAAGDLRTSIRRDYVGQFNYIKESINTIVSTLHKTMTEILSASEQVLAGAKQISTSSMTLAEGASEQASSVQQLTASVETINSQTQQNATNAATANELSDKSTQNAQNGNQEMQNMLKAMNDIKDSSNSISKVISTISEIAFQTNLLALNASVEAARAGEHGRGFAVVADEVRNLASKSQVSSNDTATLIENSNARVNEGTKIAQATADALNVIVENAAQVSGIINTIAEASRNQAEAISQVSIGLSQISQVVQNNSSTSEESAAAAQELNSQAELLQQMVSYFKI